MDNSIKDKILEMVDIVEVIGESVSLKRRGREFIGLCPFHADHNPSMSVSPTKQIFKCWSCGAGGDVIRFVQLRDRIEFPAALETLARRLGIEHRSTPAARRDSARREGLQAALTWARQHFIRNLETDAGRAAREYARRRGLTDETIKRHGLGFAPDSWNDLLAEAGRARLSPAVLEQAGLLARSERGKTYDRFRNRLVFPIADAQGRPVAFGGRALGDDPAKYLNSPETGLFSKSRVLYALNLARDAARAAEELIVVEGYMDAVMLHQYGFEQTVATLGTALTPSHVRLIEPLARRLCLCFDGDDAGTRAADRAVEVALQTALDVRVVLLPPGHDPADVLVSEGAAGFARFLKGAQDALEFKWRQTFSAYDRGGPRDKRDAVEAFLQFVANVTVAGGVDAVQQNLLIDRLGGLLGVPPQEVFDLLDRSKRAVRRGRPTVASEANADSDYAVSVRGIPAGVVEAVEIILGHLVTGPSCWRWVDDGIAAAMEHSQTWSRLYRLVLDVHENVGEYCMQDVVTRCDDGPLCELLGRARQRVAGVTEEEEDFIAARDQLARTHGVLRWGRLRAATRSSDADADDAFRQLREGVRGPGGFLPPEAECGLASS